MKKTGKWKQYTRCGLLFLIMLFMTAGCGEKREKEEFGKARMPAQTENSENERDPAEESSRAASALWEQREREKQRDTQPAEAQEEDMMETDGRFLEELSQKIDTHMQTVRDQGANVSVYAEKISSGETAVVAEQKMQAASLIKLFIAGCAYEHMEPLIQQAGSQETVEEQIRLMISVSDNDAANTLVTWLGQGDAAAGREEINLYCARNGYGSTHMGRLLLEPNDLDDNYTSVTDCGIFLKKVYHGELPGAKSLLAYMEQQERREKIPAGLPPEVVAANKTGELSDVENDAAIVFLDENSYVLCVMTEQVADPGAARTAIAGLSSLVYQYISSSMISANPIP